MTTTATTRTFRLGTIVATPNALEALQQAGISGMELISRHVHGDWGEMSADDKALNDLAIEDGSRIFSAYNLANGVKIWVITESNRSSTCILLPEDY
jgi:hypothetical protein